jgi:hypothetical protein
MIMARTVCFDELVAFETAFTNAGGRTEDAPSELAGLQRLTAEASGRTTILNLGAKLIPVRPNQLQRARGILMLCMAQAGANADAGVRDLDTFRQRWTAARAGYTIPAAVADSAPAQPAPPEPPPAPAMPPPPPDTPLMRAARSSCAAELKAFESAFTRAGTSRQETVAAINDIMSTFTEDAEPRAQVINNFDAMARDARAPQDAARLMLTACAATAGTLWSVGLRDPAEFRGQWNGRGSARFAIPGHDTKPNALGCVWLSSDDEAPGSAGTLHNTCAFTVDMRFCMNGARAGTPTESVACEKGLSRFERIEAGGSIRTTLTDGTRMSWTQCKTPLQPVQTSAPGATFTATCK